MTKIGIIAPANSIVGSKNIKLFKSGIKMLEKAGFEVIIGKNVYSNTCGICGTISEKLEDIYYVSSKAKYIMCATGGSNSNDLLEKLNFDRVKNNVFIGNSNPSLLFNALYKVNKQVSFIGPNVKTLGKYKSRFMVDSIKSVIKDNSSKVKTEEKNLVLNGGKCTGITIGGNIKSLRKILYTKYFPKMKDGFIMYIEASFKETNHTEFTNIINEFRKEEVFKNCQGIILGYYDDYKLLNNLFKEFNIPVIVCKNIGHDVHNNMVPVGKVIKIDEDGNIYVEGEENE